MSLHTVELQSGALRLALRPDLGGSICGLWHAGQPVLRSTEPAALDGPLQSACFALLPYSNRLGWRRFCWQGAEYTTLPNFADSPHSLHGVGWQRAWRVQAQHAHAITLHYQHTPDAHWPFAFAAQQQLTLHGEALRMRLALTNTDARVQPVGLGWHPYFPRRARSRVCMDVQSRQEYDAWQLPTHSTAVTGLDAPVDALDLDHCFSGWSGAARIEDECLGLRMESTLRHAVVFTPQGQDFFCVEPVGHANDAIHQADPVAHGLVALAPGETLGAAMTLEVTAA